MTSPLSEDPRTCDRICEGGNGLKCSNPASQFLPLKDNVSIAFCSVHAYPDRYARDIGHNPLSPEEYLVWQVLEC